MRNSIQHFTDFRITNLQESAKKFSQYPHDIAGFVAAVKEEALQFALDFIGETFTTCNDVLRESPVRRASWEVVRTDEKTLFRNKKSGEPRYLVDAAMGIDSHERISEDAVALMLEEIVQTCYRKGGEAVSILDKISKEAVKDKLHALKVPTEDEADPTQKKKAAQYLFIEADEDHASLLFNEKKGDLKKSESGRKLNGIITKLVYIHEGIEKDAPQSTKHHLVNPHYFCGLYEEKVKIAEGAKYVLDNWSAAKVRQTNRRSLCGCSAEGHVSHVLSSRMSTGPMGWSKTGADKMARLRAWYWNGGDVLELTRYQKQALPKAAGDEDVVLSAAQMYRDETNGNPKWAKYAEKMQVEVSPQIEKMLSIGMHDFIWTLR